MRLRFLWIGKTKDPFYIAIEEKYLKRLQRFVPTERTSVRDLKKADPRQASAQSGREARSIRKKLATSAYQVVLDEAGKKYNSQEFALFLQRLMNQGTSELTFVAGGHQGVPDRIRVLGNLKLSLSTFTLPHELARILLLEQVYRALSILKGLPYHK